MKFPKKNIAEKFIFIGIIVFISLNIFRSISLDLDGSSGSNLCSKIDSEIKKSLLYSNGEIHAYLLNEDFNGELNLGYVNFLKSNDFNNTLYVSAYLYDSDYYEGKFRAWILDSLDSPTLIFDTNSKLFVKKPNTNFQLIDYESDYAFKTAIECSRVEKHLYEQRN